MRCSELSKEPQQDDLSAAHPDQSGLPQGEELQLVIHSNWGDDSDVGITGLEVFDGTGHPITLSYATEQATELTSVWCGQ